MTATPTPDPTPTGARPDQPDPRYTDTAGRTWCCALCAEPLPLSAVRRGTYTCADCQAISA